MISLTNNRLTRFAKDQPKRAIPIYLAAALVAVVAVSALINTINKPETASATAQISITENGFIPASLVVKKGTKIIWTNTDQAKHQLQANPHPTGDSLPGLKSEILNNSQTYEYVAGEEGTFGYHDHLNPTTNGTIDVQD